MRRSVPLLVSVCLLILLRMWIARILIIWNTLSHDYMPTLWRVFEMTIVYWSLLIWPMGLFVFGFLLFLRLVPAVSMHEVRRLAHEEGVA